MLKLVKDTQQKVNVLFYPDELSLTLILSRLRSHYKKKLNYISLQ